VVVATDRGVGHHVHHHFRSTVAQPRSNLLTHVVTS
jgi:hypothetical protein